MLGSSAHWMLCVMKFLVVAASQFLLVVPIRVQMGGGSVRLNSTWHGLRSHMHDIWVFPRMKKIIPA